MELRNVKESAKGYIRCFQILYSVQKIETVVTLHCCYIVMLSRVSGYQRNQEISWSLISIMETMDKSGQLT